MHHGVVLVPTDEVNAVLEVHAFGRVRALLDGEPIELGGPRQRAVLGLLVAAGRRTVSADRFLDELWAGEPPPSAAGALQAYVSRLRSATEPRRQKRRPASVLVSSPPGYALSLPVSAVDTWQFASLVSTATGLDDSAAIVTLDRALALWVDEPFAEYVGLDWPSTEVTRLRELRADAIEARSGAALRLGRGAEALAGLDDHVRAHPLREQAVALLARAYYQCGRQAEALAALADLRVRLVDELGVDPGPELRALETDILRQAPHLAAPAGPAPPSEPTPVEIRLVEPIQVVAPQPTPGTASEPWVGREDELARLAVAAGAVHRRAGVVWVEGDAGFGKSALVTHFADTSVGDWSIVRGHCSEVAGAPPGWAWVEVLDQLDDAESGAEVRTGPRGEGTPFALADRISSLLEARGTRTMVVLEDLHRADDDTLQVLWHVVESTTAPVLLVATYRSHEVGRDLATTLALTAERTVDRIVLGGLDDHDARELLARHLGSGLPEKVWARLVERSAGNPLFLRQLAHLVASEGVASVETVPAAIRDLLLRRIDRLPDATAEALSRAAVLGRDIDFDLVLALEQEVGDPDEEVVAAHLDAGLVAGLLESPRPAELRFTHALVRDIFYQRLPPLRRTRLHRAALAAYRQHLPERLDEMAHHATASLDRRTAAEAATLLRAAASQSNHAGAVPHLRAALRALDLAGAEPAERLDVRLDLVRSLARDGDTVGASAERLLAVADARAHGDAADVARAWQWQTPMMWSRSVAENADDAVIEGLRALLDQIDDDDLPLRIEVLNALVIEADPWNVDAVVAASDQALASAEQLGDPELLCRALNAAFFATFAHDDTDVLTHLGERLLRTAEGARLHGYTAVAHVMLHSAAVGRADLGTAGAHVEAAVRAGTSGQLPELALLTSIFDATTRLLQSDLPGARDVFDHVCRQLEAAGDPNVFHIRLWGRFAIEYAAGDVSSLLDDARRMTELMPWHSTDLLVAALLDAGDVEQARAAWRPTPLQRDATWLFDAAVRAHVVVGLGDVDRARELRDELLPWSGQLTRTLNGALSMGPVDHFLGLLAGLLGDDAAAHDHAARTHHLTGPGQATTWDRTWVRSLRT